MTRRSLFFILLLTLFSVGGTRAQAPSQTSRPQSRTEKPLAEMIERALERAREQSLILSRALEPLEGRLPKTTDDAGRLVTSDPGWWCSGFFPGVLWYLYEDSGDERLAAYAEMFTRRLEEVQYITDNHDVGFMLFCSYGHGWRLKAPESYRQVLLNGAASLATRYDPRIGLIRSWDFNRERWNYPVIIDNMMNLELLLWASRASGDARYRRMAVSHADKTLKNHFRPDASCYHVVSYDSRGRVEKRETWQGLHDESAWSRGQGWALYGFTYMYRETGHRRYLRQAVRVADYLLGYPSMPSDGIPPWDLDVADPQTALRDASAAAVIASALVELSDHVEAPRSARYRAFAERQLRSLSSETYLAAPGENGGFILRHSVGFYAQHSEVDKPLTYADYYYVEALLRMKRRLVR